MRERLGVRRQVAGVTSGDRAVMGLLRRWIAMTSEAEVMKARLGPCPEVGSAAAMAAVASAVSAAIREVMMALHAADAAMLVVRKVDGQGT